MRAIASGTRPAGQCWVMQFFRRCQADWRMNAEPSDSLKIEGGLRARGKDEGKTLRRLYRPPNRATGCADG